MSKAKKKSSKKRRSKDGEDVPPTPTPNPTSNRTTEETDESPKILVSQASISSTAPVPSEIHHKKRKRQDPADIREDKQDNVTQPDGPSAASRKRKKKSKKKSKGHVDVEKSTNDSRGPAPSSPTLEGHMMDGQIVLIDRAADIVYSGLERMENGDRKQVGTVDKNGTIRLDTEPLVVTPTERTPEEASTPNDAAPSPAPASAIFPFETDPDDHCESPREAYQDIVPFLQASGKSPSELSIYDPYYCDGAVARNMKVLGFPNVYNRKEDCYQIWNTPSRYPTHDILITNPPYSADHMESLIRHITSATFGNRPWMLLLPQWVHKKDYFQRWTAGIRPFFVVPKKRYVYLPPPSFRESKKSDVHKKSSPFVSMWYVWGGTVAQNDQWLQLAQRRLRSTCDVARSKSALRDLRRKGTTTTTTTTRS